MKYIDLENWKRKEHFLFFNRMDYPQYNICLNMDISNFLNHLRNRNISFYYAMIYAVTKIVNDIEEFRYRIRDGKVVLHERIHPSFTYMDADKNDNLFKMVTVELNDDIREFTMHAEKEAEEQRDYFGIDKLTGRDDLIYITSIPWISFTHISHTISLNRNDSVPRISWGKYFEDKEKIMLPFSVQVNHALIDGFHIGKYTERLQAYLDNFR